MATGREEAAAGVGAVRKKQNQSQQSSGVCLASAAAEVKESWEEAGEQKRKEKIKRLNRSESSGRNMETKKRHFYNWKNVNSRYCDYSKNILLHDLFVLGLTLF